MDWITVHPNGKDGKGQPIPVLEGQTKKEAIKSFVEKHKNKSIDELQKEVRQEINTKAKFAESPTNISESAQSGIVDKNTKEHLVQIGILEEEINKLGTCLSGLNKKAQEMYLACMKKGFEVSNDGVAFHDPKNDKIYLTYGDTHDTIIHELSHSLDKGAIFIKKEYYTIQSASKLIEEYMEDKKVKPSDFAHSNIDYEYIINKLKLKTDAQGNLAKTKNGSADPTNAIKFRKWINNFKSEMPSKDFSRVVDIVASVTYGMLGEETFDAHEAGYWLTREKDSKLGDYSSQEQWANFCSLKAKNSNKALNLLKGICPNTFDCLEKTYKKVFNDER